MTRRLRPPVIKAAPAEPSDYQTWVLTEATTGRGTILTAYAQVDSLFTDLMMRSQALPGYERVFSGLPYTSSEKVRVLTKVLAVEGEFSRYRGALSPLIGGLSEFEKLRHFMAHGLLIIRTHKADWHELIYRMWVKSKGQPPMEEILFTNIESLSQDASDLQKYAQAVVSTIGPIYLELDLEARFSKLGVAQR